MHKLLSPALFLMNRLKYPQKFLLVGLLLVLPLGLVMGEFVTQINKDIDFAAQEKLGLVYNKPLVNFLHDIQEHAGISVAYLSGDASFADRLVSEENEIDEDIKAVDLVDQQLGGTLRTTDKWEALKKTWLNVKNSVLAAKKGWQGLKNTVHSITAQESYDAHTALSNATLTLITDVGNNSKLILDPDIDSYYLMDIAITKLPLATEYINQLRSYGMLVIARKTVAAEDKTRLAIVGGLANSTLETTDKDLQYVFAENPAVQSKVTSQFQSYNTEVNRLLTVLNWQIMGAGETSDPNSMITTSDYFDAGATTIESGFKFYDVVSPALNDLLQVRQDNLVGRRSLVILVALGALVLSIYLFDAFYVAVKNTIARLDEASKRMVSGTMTGTVVLENRDELGQVAASFNQIAGALVSASSSLRAIVDNAADGIITFNENGVIESFNNAAEKIYGYTADEVIGEPVTMLLAETFADQFHQAITSNNINMIYGAGEVEGRRKDGATFPADVSTSEVRLEDRRVLTTILRDITDRKRIERNLAQRTHDLEVANAMAKEANRLKSEFLSTMSHELRTPLNAIVGFTDLLLTGKPGPINDTQRMFLERASGNNRRLLNLINDILDLSRIEAGRMEVHLAPYSPREMLERIAAQTSSLFNQKGLDFKLNIDQWLPDTVVGDRDRVEQIVVNLLSNAAKFTITGEVELAAVTLNNLAWSVAVRDTGPGIAPHMQEMIFEPFRQVDGTTTRQAGGSGLGLAIARELCLMMDGTLLVQSDIGKGSTFTMTLPIGIAYQELSAQHIQAMAG